MEETPERTVHTKKDKKEEFFCKVGGTIKCDPQFLSFFLNLFLARPKFFFESHECSTALSYANCNLIISLTTFSDKCQM